MSLLLQESSRSYECAIVERGTREFGSAKRCPRTHRVASIRRREATARMDEDLAGLAQRGDAHAFGELVERHFATCFKRAFLILRYRNDAEDEVQNAFAKAFESLHQFRFEGTFSAWLCRIVQNQCLMRLRERRQTGFVSVDTAPDASGKLELINQVASPEDELGAREVDHLLRTQISRDKAASPDHRRRYPFVLSGDRSNIAQNRYDSRSQSRTYNRQWSNYE